MMRRNCTRQEEPSVEQCAKGFLNHVSYVCTGFYGKEIMGIVILKLFCNKISLGNDINLNVLVYVDSFFLSLELFNTFLFQF